MTALLAAAAVALQTLVPITEPVTHLDEVGIYRVGYALRGKPEVELPLGWSGRFDEASGVSCLAAGTQNGKAAFLLHPPWTLGAGFAFQEFELKLPQSKFIELKFSVAMRSDAVGKSDGVTFSVTANGEPLARQAKNDDAWQEFRFDLTRFSGQAVRLRFECDCGPANNTAFDHALWGDRELKVAGPSGASAPKRKQVEPPLTPLLNNSAGLAPSVAAGFRNVVRKGELVYEGADGRLVYRVDPRPGFLEGVTLEVLQSGGRTQTVAVAHGAELRLVGEGGKPVSSRAAGVEAKMTDCRSDVKAGAIIVQQEFSVCKRIAAVRTEYSITGKTLRVNVSSDDAVIAAVDFGRSVLAAVRRQVSVPYLGEMLWLPQERLFARMQLDWTASEASWHRDTTAGYEPLTDGARNAVRETALVTFSWDAREAMPNIPNKPSPFRKLLGEKVMLDVWSGKFADNAAWLRELAGYRIGPFQIIAHVWQNGGYDNKLPNVLPAHEPLGGDAGMTEWVDTAKRLGHLISLHENHADFYPNAAAWNANDIARDSKGGMVKAWFNPGTKMQSFAVAPTAITNRAARFSTEVRDRFHPNAMYLDVHSAVPPWFHADHRAGVPGAGRHKTVWEAHRGLWAQERELFAGPVWGEGNEHWRWSGLLDGVEAQFGTGWPHNGGETAPLLVDFDLLKIHPLQFNHGMGYYERWLTDGEKNPMRSGLPQVKLDQYRMQEIAYGHAGFLGDVAWRQLPVVWQEAGLMRDVQMRYAAASVREISYETGGRFVSLSEALAARAALDRVRIAYDNGLTLWCNGRSEMWFVKLREGVVMLPQYGWLASGAGVTAWTSWRDGVVADFSQTDSRIYANARTTAAASGNGLVRARPTVRPIGAFEAKGDRKFVLRYYWRVGQPIGRECAQFIHFTDPKTGEIVFQADAPLPKPTSQWWVGEAVEGPARTIEVPAIVPDGRYRMVVGLYDERGRVRLEGMDDGEQRIILGTLEVREQGRMLTFTPETREPEDVEQVYREHVNTKRKKLEFGPLETDGSVLMEREKDGAWLLTPFPRGERFAVALRGKSVEALDADLKPKGPVPTKRAGKRIEFEVGAPGVAHYRVR